MMCVMSQWLFDRVLEARFDAVKELEFEVRERTRGKRRNLVSEAGAILVG